ncbi:hypothetical protein ACPCHQ_16980 [Ralstonia thomasii]|jgi:hypothetical protein|uniref:Uncharacterized protein n=3 Tax=Pseudomonadota TaxID=1224 RepID=A0ABN9JC67_9RALS|nr:MULTISPECIES: hypothetical protein [Ralstonia]MBT2177779.1 hypothetical protein [Ralstonia pickettii]RFC01264.1 hypothetical protein DDJ70_33545 [Klebsiella michiganensis]CAJ0710674.1 hypothetical protein LMG7143_01680 [Ralstonia sp. LMG 18095]CAJ0806343.1 hypothetical protein LMG18095_04425 [Ralstonia sp. LMG 18095]
MAKTKSSAPAVAAMGQSSDEERKWRARSDMRTLTEAEEIKRDKSRHDAAQKMACEELEKMQAIAKSAPKDTTEPTKKSGGRETMDSFVARREGKKK